MTKGPKRLRPDDPKESDAPHVDLGEDPIENISEQMQAHPRHDRLTSSVPVRARHWCVNLGLPERLSRYLHSQAIGNITKDEGHRDL